MKYKIFIILMLFVSTCLLQANIVDISGITEITNTDSLKLRGTIKNIQIAPFNKDLMSFELETDKNTSLYLFNRVKKRLLKIESKQIINSKKDVRLPKDINLSWHPNDKWFTFNGNAGNRNNIYTCRITDDALNNKFAVKAYRLDFKEPVDENDKPEKANYKEPVFSANGQTIFFIRKSVKKGETAALCKSLDFETIKDLKFKDLTFEVIAKKKYDLSKPQVSPKQDVNLVAFVANQNKLTKKSKDPYLEYTINVINADSKEETVVNNCDGFTSYSHFWNSTGDYLYYYKAIPREKLSQEDLTDRFNVLNLYATKINQAGTRTISIPQSNQQTDVIMGNVVDRGLTAIDEANLLIPVSDDNFYSIAAVNLDKWRRRETDYCDTIELKYPSYYPQFANNELVYVSFKSISDDEFLDMISSTKIKLKFPAGSKPETPLATNVKENAVAPKIEVKPVIPPITQNKTTIPPVATVTKTTPLPLPTDIKAAATALLKDKGQLTLIEIMNKLNIPIENKEANNQLTQILLNIADVNTVGSKLFFALKGTSEAPKDLANQENTAKLAELNKELQSLKAKNGQLESDLALTSKEKNNESQTLADMSTASTAKQAEITALELKIKHTKEAGSNQIALLNAQLDGLKAESLTIDAELTKAYDDISLSTKNIPEFTAEIETLKKEIDNSNTAISTLESSKQNALEDALAAEQKSLAEEAARVKAAELEAARIKAAEIEADNAKAAQAKAAELEAANKNNAYSDEDTSDEYADEDEEGADDEYSEEDEDSTPTAPVAPKTITPTSVKKRR